MAFITAETRSTIVELAMGMLNQAPSTTLLSTLIEKSTSGSSTQDLADYIATTDAFTAEYPATQTAREFATEMFGKLITGGTLDADINTAVIDLLEGLLIAGTTKAQGFVAVIEFLANPANADHPDLGDIAQSFQNRADAAEYFVVTKELGGSTDAELAAAISSVTSDAATLTAANTAADATASAEAVVAGQTFTLTTGLDNKTLGAGADQAFATDSTTAADDTFNVSDLVTGGAGEDTFFLTVDSLAADTTYAPSRITGFEKLSVTNIDATPDALTVNTNLMGLSSVEVSASTADVLFTNVTAGSAVSLLGNTSDVTVTMKNAGLTGATDSATLAVTGNTGAVVIDSDGVADIELATITATGTNSGALTIGDNSAASTVTALTVLGTGSYDLESAGSTIDDELETLDASANSGGVTFTTTIATDSALTGGSGNDVLTGGAGNDVIKGGAGEDTLAMGSGGKDHLSGGAGNDTITATGATKDDTISGGDGVDTLVIGSALAYDDEAEPTAIDNAANISGFEVLATSASLTQNMTPLTGVVAVSAVAGVATITKASGIADFFATADSTGLDMTLATDGTEDSLNIHVGSDTNQTNSTGVTVDAIEVETALIASLGADSNTVTDFEADALTKLSVIGKKSISITLNDSAAVATIPLTEVDASGFSGSSLTITAQEADSGVTVTTGSEALTVTVGDGANSITGTAGDDSVTTGKGADTIAVGEGDNTVSAGDGANTITAGDGGNTITDGEGVGTITVGAGDNTITLGDGADVVVAGAGDNTITNAAGNATITSGDGESTVTNTSGNSTITLGDGGNTVNLTAGNSTVVTGSGADDINITAGNNNITAGAGNDTISLGSGNDTVDAGTGTDAVDFSVSSGTWTGSISDAESITATFGGSATIDFDGIADYDTLVVTANDTASSATVKNIASSTISLSDDAVETGGDGDIVDLTIDTVADAVISIAVGANQEAASASAADLESLTITDASSLALSSSGGSLTNVLTHDLESVVLDDDETTAVSVTAGAYTGIQTGHLTNTDALESVTLTSSGAEADLTVEDIEDGSNLSSLSLSASGLNSTINVSEVGGTDSAILDTISMTASNGSTITMNEDIITAEDATSISLSSDGTGSSIAARQISADGLEVDSLTLAASDGATIDAEANSGNVIDFLPGALAISTSGTGSTIAADVLTYDAGALATTESSISISAQGASSVLSLDASTLGGAEVDLVSLVVGGYATLNLSGDGEDSDDSGASDLQSTITATSDIGTLTIQVDDYGTLSTAETDIGAEASATSDVLTIEGDYIGTFNLTIAENATWDAGTVLTIGTDSEAAVGIENLNINLEDMGDETDVVLGAEGLVDIGGTDYISIGDAEGEESTYYAGSIVLQGNEDNVITVGADALEADLIQSTAGTDGVYGSWTLTTGSGADAVTGGSGADTINVGAGADTVDGGAGNDVITAGNGADEITVGAGKDTVNLTETVSAADQVILTAELQGSAAGADEGTFTNYNVITGFDTLVDHINHDDASFAGAALTFVVANTAATAAASDLAAANFADVDSVLAFLNDAEVEDTIAADSDDYAAAEDILVAVTLGNGTTAIYEIIGATAGTLVAADIALLGTVDTTMVIGDFM